MCIAASLHAVDIETFVGSLKHLQPVYVPTKRAAYQTSLLFFFDLPPTCVMLVTAV